MKKNLMVVFCTVVMLGGLGCAAVSHYLTPTSVDEGGVDYVVERGGGDPNDYKSWLWPNLVDAQKLDRDLDLAHDKEQLRLRQLMDTDDQEYAGHKGVSTSNVTSGIQREGFLFGEKGILSMGLALLGVGGASGILGLMRKRPQDITRADFDKALASTKEESHLTLAEKEKHLTQLVKGIQKYMGTLNSDNGNLSQLKTILNETQDDDTRLAVKKIKQTIIT